MIAMFVALNSATVLFGQARPTTKPVPEIRRVMIISVDGLRPDLMVFADVPHLREMCRSGSFSLWARSTPASITIPTHVSMLTGVVPEAHAIMWNGDLPLSAPVYPTASTIFELAHRAGYSTAMVAGKRKLSILDKPATIDWKWFASSSTSEDADVLAESLRILREHRPELMFIHFPSVDNAGHAAGWGTDAQLAAVSTVDDCIGKIVSTLGDLKLDGETLLIVTADHGGAGRTHGAEDARSRTIPWILSGPGVRKGFDLTRLGREKNIEVYDTFATTAAVLGIPIRSKIDGVFVKEAFENQELLISTYQPSMQPTTRPGD